MRQESIKNDPPSFSGNTRKIDIDVSESEFNGREPNGWAAKHLDARQNADLWIRDMGGFSAIIPWGR